MSDIEVSLYRMYRPDGTPWKDWAIAIVGNELRTYFGKTATPLRSRAVSVTGNAFTSEMQIRINEKEREGYRYVGHAKVMADGSCHEIPDSGQLDQTTPPAPARVLSEDEVYYEIRLLPGTPDVEPTASLRQFMLRAKRAAEIMENHAKDHVTHYMTGDFDWFYEIGAWTFSVVSGKPTPGQRNVLARQANSNVAGTVQKSEGVFALLFLMYLRQHADPNVYEVSLSWKDGVEVTEQLRGEHDLLAMFGCTLDEIRPVAVSLGLAEQFIDLAALKGESSMYF